MNRKIMLVVAVLLGLYGTWLERAAIARQAPELDGEAAEACTAVYSLAVPDSQFNAKKHVFYVSAAIDNYQVVSVLETEGGVATDVGSVVFTISKRWAVNIPERYATKISEAGYTASLSVLGGTFSSSSGVYHATAFGITISNAQVQTPIEVLVPMSTMEDVNNLGIEMASIVPFPILTPLPETAPDPINPPSFDPIVYEPNPFGNAVIGFNTFPNQPSGDCAQLGCPQKCYCRYNRCVALQTDNEGIGNDGCIGATVIGGVAGLVGCGAGPIGCAGGAIIGAGVGLLYCIGTNQRQAVRNVQECYAQYQDCLADCGFVVR